MPVAETHAANQWPAEQFHTTLQFAVHAEQETQPFTLRDGVHVRGLLLKLMLAKITPTGNA